MESRCQGVKRPRVDLTSACLVDVPQHVRGHAAPMTKSTEKAKDPKAIKARFSGNGRCVCVEHKARNGPPCHRRVALGTLVQLCVALVGMSQEEKGFIFHHMYTEASNPSDEKSRGLGVSKRSRRLRWYIGDRKMCFTNFCYMLFTSPSTIREYVSIEAGPDGKRISKRHTSMPKRRHKGHQGQQVDFFFQEYYQSAGEPLPQISQRRQQHSQVDGEDVDADVLQNINGQWGPWLNKDDPLNKNDNDEYDPDRPIVSTAHMCTLACDGAVVGLPIRFIQHSSLWSLYWQFLAHWDALKTCGRLDLQASQSRGARGKRQGVEESAPSFSTFQRRWQEVWMHYLRFRKSSTHAQCNTCFKLQQVMFERGSSVAERLDAARLQSQNACHAT